MTAPEPYRHDEGRSTQPLIPEVLEAGERREPWNEQVGPGRIHVRRVSCWPGCLVVSLVASVVLTLLLNAIF